MEFNYLVHTIGHSNHDLSYFMELLKLHKITCVIDVRTVAASTYNPQFNQHPLQAALKQTGILYMHFKEEFGARQTDEAVLNEAGKVNFKLVQKNPVFKNGVRRVEAGIEKGYRIALMCSEANPLDCHRFSMIAAYLIRQGIKVLHILKDGSAVSHAELEVELMKKFEKKLPQASLFEPDISLEHQLNFAYYLHNQAIGWNINDTGKTTTEDYD